MAYQGERSFSEVVESIVGNIQTIIRSEIRLARAEIKRKQPRPQERPEFSPLEACSDSTQVDFFFSQSYAHLKT